MEGELNIRTVLALLGFFPVALVVAKRYRAAVAGGVLLISAVLFLPMLAVFKLPALPELDKYHLGPLATLIGLLVFRPNAFRGLRVGPVPWLIMGVSLFGALVTLVSNGDPQTFGTTYIPGLGFTDAIHFIVDEALRIWVPFFIGAACFRNYSDLRTLIQLIVGLAFIYLIPIVMELRLSPQMHNWVYGYAQHQFAQTIRGGGYRPMVFMSHGLALSLYVSAAFILTPSLIKAGERTITARWRRSVPLPQGWSELGVLGLVLVFVKSMGALVFGMVSAPLVMFTKPTVQHVVAVVLVVGFVAYPFARSAGAIPDEALIQFATDQFGEERAESLEFRLTNERVLITRTNKRLMFGWGGYCRACIFDPQTGDRLSIRDGAWIITLGDRGVFGFLGQFGVMIYAILLAFRNRRRVQPLKAKRLYAALTLVIALYLFDSLPNAMFNYLPILYAGAVIGVTPGLRQPTQSQNRAARRKARKTQRLSGVDEVPGEPPATPPEPAPLLR